MNNENMDINFKYWGYIYEMLNNIHTFGGLRIVILYELKNGPLNGIEISKNIEKKTEKLEEKRKKIYYKTHKEYENDPFTRKIKRKPSPGSLYPRLKKMREEGLIVKRSDGKYENTELGNNKINEVLESIREKEEYFKGNPIENALADLDHIIGKLENTEKTKLNEYEDDLIDLSRRLKKLAGEVYSKN